MAAMSPRTPMHPGRPADRRHRRHPGWPSCRSARWLSRPRTAERAARVGRAPRSSSPRAAAEIVPGSVSRSSLFLDATYDAYLRISWGTRKISVDSTATIRNTSGAPIDRVELNTIAARLGSIRLHRSRSTGSRPAPRGATRRSSSRSAASCRSMPRPGSGSASAPRCGAACPARTGCSRKANGIIDLYRWLPWVSRRIAFDRPNHGDPFETPSSRSVEVRIIDLAEAGSWPRPATGPRSAPTG